MIKYFVFIIIIILLFILISCLFNLKEKFELNEVKNNQNTLKKLDLHDESIYYQKGEVGIGGEKGRRGDTGESGLDGARGEQGQNGVNGNNYGNIIFEDSYGHEIDRIPPYYSQSNSITPIASDIKIIIPDGKQGPDGLIPPIKFYKEDTNEVLGVYNPPPGTPASNLETIIIRVPIGVKGDKGASGANAQHPKGDKGEIGETGVQGEKGDDGNDSPLKGIKGIDGGLCNLGIPNDPGCDITFESVIINNNGRICKTIGADESDDVQCCIDYDLLKSIDGNNYMLIEQRLKRMIKLLCNLTYSENYGIPKESITDRDEMISYYKAEINKCYQVLEDRDYDFDTQIKLGVQCQCGDPEPDQIVPCGIGEVPNPQYIG